MSSHRVKRVGHAFQLLPLEVYPAKAYESPRVAEAASLVESVVCGPRQASPELASLNLT